jgi:hypothetical protein
MNIGESDHIDGDLGIPTWTQNQRPSDNNQRKRLSIQVMTSANFSLGGHSARANTLPVTMRSTFTASAARVSSGS